jgi:hypothetical protein
METHITIVALMNIVFGALLVRAGRATYSL